MSSLKKRNIAKSNVDAQFPPKLRFFPQVRETLIFFNPHDPDEEPELKPHLYPKTVKGVRESTRAQGYYSTIGLSNVIDHLYYMDRKILLVEDTLDALHNLRDLLSMEGFEIAIATDGSEAIQALQLFTPDLIITDLGMPNMDGFTFVENIKNTEQLRSIPVIVFSANGTAENEMRSRQLGVSRFLVKPSSVDIILKSIHEILSLNKLPDSTFTTAV